MPDNFCAFINIKEGHFEDMDIPYCIYSALSLLDPILYSTGNLHPPPTLYCPSQEHMPLLSIMVARYFKFYQFNNSLLILLLKLVTSHNLIRGSLLAPLVLIVCVCPKIFIICHLSIILAFTSYITPFMISSSHGDITQQWLTII